MARGGKREGAGRKPGKMLRLLELLETKGKTDKKNYVDEFVEYLLENYKKDSRLTAWMADHIFGKAPQPISNANDEPFKLTFDPTFNASAPKAKGDS